VNLFSAVLAALTLAQIYWISRLLGAGRVAALVGPIGLAITEVFWWHAVIAEVYTAASAFLALVILLCLLWKNTRNVGYLFAAGLVGGLSLGVHNTVNLAAPAVVVFLLVSRCNKSGWIRAVLGAAAGIVLFLAAFFWMDILNPPASFNNVVGPSSDLWGYPKAEFQSHIKRFEFLFFAAQWRSAMFSSTPAQVNDHAELYFTSLQKAFPWPVIAMTGLGVLALFLGSLVRRKPLWAEGLFLVLTWLVLFFYIINYDIGDIYTFYIPTYVPVMSTAGAGLGILVSGVMAPFRRWGALAVVRAVGGLLALVVLFFAFWPSRQLVVRCWDAQRITFLDGTDYEWYPYPVHDPASPHDVAERIVSHLQPDAILFTDWSQLYDVFYVANVEAGKPGIVAHETYPFVGEHQRFSRQATEYIRENIANHPVYFTQTDPDLQRDYRFLMVDSSIPLYRLQPR
jgi:hypothetical protein